MESQRIKDMTAKTLAKHTGKTVEQINKDTERDNFLTSDEAVAYGLVDKVVYPLDETQSEES